MFPKDLDNVTIWALNYSTSDIRRKYIADSIKEGLSRFGWSWMAHHDLTILRRQMEEGQISDEDQEMYNRCNFLFDIRPGDWLVHVNVPENGKCIAVPVVGTVNGNNGVYSFDTEESETRENGEDDYRSLIPVDGRRAVEFDRNDMRVPPRLQKSGLTPHRRFHSVHDKSGFFHALEAICNSEEPVVDVSKGVYYLRQDMETSDGALDKITKAVHHRHPSHDLEGLVARVFKELSCVHSVHHQKGRSDKGADLVVVYSANSIGFPLTGVEDTERKLLVQVKSYEGAQNDFHSMNQLRDAFEHHQHKDAHGGLIFTTATASEEFRDELNKRNDEGRFGVNYDNEPRQVHLIDGQNVARFLLNAAPEVLLG